MTLLRAKAGNVGLRGVARRTRPAGASFPLEALLIKPPKGQVGEREAFTRKQAHKPKAQVPAERQLNCSGPVL